jgi:galactokinase
MSLVSVVERASEMFAKCFGAPPLWKAAAPGRVNLIGEHTDYNEGFVLPMAIERFTVLVANRSTRREVTLHSVTTGETATFSLRTRVERGTPSWSNYVRGVVAGFQERGIKVGGFNAGYRFDGPVRRRCFEQRRFGSGSSHAARRNGRQVS